MASLTWHRARHRFAMTVFGLHFRLGVAIAYALLAFVVIFGVDIIWNPPGARWSWFWPRMIRDVIEASAVALLASYLYRLREKRHRQLRYLNNHLCNALTVLQMAEHLAPDSQSRAAIVNNALDRISVVVEQISRDEDMSINHQEPEKYKAA